MPTDSTRLPPTALAPLETEPTRQPSTSPDSIEAPLQRRTPRAALSIGIASLTAIAMILGIRQLGWLQSAELRIFDRMVQLSPDPGPDPRLLVVGITDADIQAQKQFPLSDRSVAQVLRALKAYKPTAIGLDLLRDVPQEPGRADLTKELKAPNVIAITQLGNAGVPATPSPPGVPSKRVGFNDQVLDDDGVIRRNLLFADSKTSTLYSFSLRLALTYLATQKSCLSQLRTIQMFSSLAEQHLSPWTITRVDTKISMLADTRFCLSIGADL